jgi:hypothetical protein
MLYFNVKILTAHTLEDPEDDDILPRHVILY